MKIAVCVTGASGLQVAERLVEELKGRGHTVYLVVTSGARLVAKEEGFNLKRLESLADKEFKEEQLGCELASTSNFVDAVVIVPASLKTIGLVASGIQENLVARLAGNALRLGKKLVVCPRETPVSAIDLENMARIARAGGVILPLNLAFYFKPKSLEDLVNFLAGKILDTLGIENKLYKRWKA